MKTTKFVALIILLIGGFFIVPDVVHAQKGQVEEEPEFFNMTVGSLGEGYVLEAVKVGQSYRLRMTPSNNTDAQLWFFQTVSEEDFTFVMYNKMAGPKLGLTVSKEGKNNQLKLAGVNRADDGRVFTVQPVDEESKEEKFRFISTWQGESKSISVIERNGEYIVILDETSQDSNQVWTPIEVEISISK